MAVGNPRLAAWYSTGDLRLYEFSEGAFVQIGIVGGLPNALSPNSTGHLYQPTIRFPYDSEYIAIHTATADTTARVYTYLPNLLYRGYKVVSQAFPQAARGLATFDQSRNIWVFRADEVNTSNNQAKILSTGLFDSASVTAPGGNGTEYMRCFEASPDGNFLIEGRIFPQLPRLHRFSAESNGFPIYTAPTNLDTDKNVTVAAWSTDSRFACIGDGVNGGVSILELDTDLNTMTKTHDLPVGVSGLPVSIAFSPDQRMLAVGFDDAGTLTTVTYRRSGAFFIQFDVLNGIGSLLNFSADGALLIDGQKRKCFKFDGEFTELTGAMDNIVAGAVVQAVSTHAVNPLAFGTLYDGTISAIIGETIDYANIRLALLSEFASFDPTHASLAAVTNGGLYSVTSGQYPAAGELITGITEVDEGAVYALKANDITRIIIDTNLVFKHAVAYDATNDTPLAWFDYTQTRTIPKNTELTLAFRDGNFITFAR